MDDPADKIYMTRTCAECPWRTDVPTGRFPPERYKALLNTCVPGGIPKPMFACHKSPEGQEKACAGMLLVEGPNLNSVRVSVALHRIDLNEITAAGPLYENFCEMAKANGYDPGPDWNQQNNTWPTTASTSPVPPSTTSSPTTGGCTSQSSRCPSNRGTRSTSRSTKKRSS